MRFTHTHTQTSGINICAVVVMFVFLQRLYKSYPPLQAVIPAAETAENSSEDDITVSYCISYLFCAISALIVLLRYGRRLVSSSKESPRF